MKIEIYVNWGEQEILLPQDYQERKETLTKEYLSDLYKETLEEVLDDYLPTDIFYFDNEDRAEIHQAISDKIKTRVNEDMEEDYEKITLEI